MARYFYGEAARGPYFEGWYFKLQTGKGDALALIPAFHMDRTGRRSASLQVIARDRAWWLEYPASEFSAQTQRLCIRVGENHFTEQSVQLDLEREGLSLHGTVHFGPFMALSSDIMGPFRFLPKMECSHGVISMAHGLEGQLVQNGKTVDFSGGIGYVETDRGRSFPQNYLWTQCAWPGTPRSGLMLAAATIPLPVGSFCGCIGAVMHEGKEYRLATYRGARIVRWSEREAVIRQGSWYLSARLEDGEGQPLQAPVEGDMARTIHERLCGTVHYQFSIGKDLVLEHIGRCAGFEASGGTQDRSGQA